MSAKWVRSQQWDDRHLTGALWPVKVVVRLFSWIGTAVVLLSLVALYGILASVPIGLIAKIPTVGFYGLTFVLLVALGCVLPVWLAANVMKTRGAGRGARFAVGIIGFVVLFVACAAIWWLGVWPQIRYDAITHTGVRFFGAFTDKYQAVQFRRLPMMEMSELEFYAWWPLRVVLLLFVLNLVTATIRRIEFTFPRIGVLTVHTGIVTIALGSIYYTTHKQEGDMLLLASTATDEQGRPVPGAPGRAETGFYDNTRVAMWVTQDKAMGWEQRPLPGSGAIPRYNNYNLDAVARSEPRQDGTESLPALDVAVPDGAPESASTIRLIDDDIKFRIVGFASYCEMFEQWVPAPKTTNGVGVPSNKTQRLRTLDMVLTTALPNGQQLPKKTWTLLPDVPAERFEFDALGVEYTIGMPEWRWEALKAELPARTSHALMVEHPASGFKGAFPIQNGKSIVVGETGYTLTVKSLSPTPPMPLVTKGYQGATSSVAIVRVDPPAGADGKKAVGFERWIYSRFPEITQDLSDELNERGMPKRRDADPAIRITYIDNTELQAYFDERPDGSVRAIVRVPGGAATESPNLKTGDKVQIVPAVAIRVGEKFDNAMRVEVPEIVPENARDRERIGNHQASAVAVEVRDKNGVEGVHWVPFTQYLSIGGAQGETDRTVRLADGRSVSIAFGRIRHEFWPPMKIRLHEFEMTPYEHSDTPKDYRSDVVLETSWAEGEKKPDAPPDIRRTSLNNPLLVVTPYVAPPGMPLPGRILGRMMSLIAPNQYKFAQAGWDQGGWRQSEAAVARGELAKPMARFTILGVGNNPGIYIIASGAVMMSIGIPWAFYLKPWLMQRQKKKIQKQLAREGKGPGSPKFNGTAKAHAPEQSSEEVSR